MHTGAGNKRDEGSLGEHHQGHPPKRKKKKLGGQRLCLLDEDQKPSRGGETPVRQGRKKSGPKEREKGVLFTSRTAGGDVRGGPLR